MERRIFQKRYREKGRSLNIFISILFFFSLFPNNVFSSSKASGIAEVSVSEWFSFANASWSVSGPFGSGDFVSELEFDDIDSNIPIVSGEIKPFSWLSFDLAYGSGSISNGTVTDSDWITDPSSGLTNFLTSRSKSSIVDDKTMFLSFNFYFDMFKLIKLSHSSKFHLDLFLGYMHYQDKIRFTDGVRTVVNEVNTSSSIPGLNSTYDFYWNVVRLGLRARHLFPKDIFIKGKFAFLPFIKYDGEAFWNLRTDFRSTKPNFEHDAIGHLGFDLNLTVGYQPIKWFVISAGYKYLYMRAKNGTANTFFADGTTGGSNLDKVEVSRHGPFISLSLTY